MRIATFNLENLDDRPNVAPPLAQRIAVLRPQLLRLDCDLLCLQEVNAQSRNGKAPRRLRALERLIESTPYADFARAATISTSGSGPADRHNLVILSRWPIEESRQIRHDLVAPALHRAATALPPAAAREPVHWDRPALAVRIALPSGRRFHLVNLHLRAPLAAPVAGQKLDPLTWKSVGGWAEGFYIAGIKRSGQALEVRLAIEAIFDAEPEALIAVCGDCNAEEGQTPLRLLQGDVEDTGNSALTGRVLVSLAHTLPESQRFSVLHHGHKLMLDHMLVSKRLMAFYRHVEVHNEGLGDEYVAHVTTRPHAESFHAPMVAAFDLATA